MKFFRNLSPSAYVVLIIFLVIILLAISGNRNMYRKSMDESLRSIEESLLKASIQCYALEGSYPENLQYLRDNYGIRLDEDTFFYHYELFSSNVEPIIVVVNKGD